jgi:O-antigen ligase
VNFIATALLLVTALFHNPVKEKLRLLKQRPYLYLIFAFFGLLVLSLVLSTNQKAGFRYLDSRLPLLYFPLTVGLVSLSKELRDKILLAMAAIISLVTLACVSYGIYQTLSLGDSAYLYNDALTIPVTGHQSIYISLLVNIAIYIYAYFVFYQPAYKRFNPLFIVSLLFLYLASFLLASRNLMLVLYISTLGFAFYQVIKKKKWLEGATLVIGLFIGIFLVYKFFPKTINRFKELTYTQFSYQQTGPESHYNMDIRSDQWNGANTRLAIWQCGWEVFKQQPLFGVGLGDKKDKLMEVYREKDFQFAIRTEKNLHNNYFDILVSLGIVGLTLFLVSWILFPLRVAWVHKDGLAILVIISFALAMFTENYFDRSMGGMLFGFFIPFLLCDKTAKN